MLFWNLDRGRDLCWVMANTVVVMKRALSMGGGVCRVVTSISSVRILLVKVLRILIYVEMDCRPKFEGGTY